MKTQISIAVKGLGGDRNMEDSNIDCIVHRNYKHFNDARIELSRVLGIPQNLSIRISRAVCTCSQMNINKDNSSVNLEMYCIYEAPTDVFLLDELQCDNEDGDVLSDTMLEFVSEAIAKMRREQNKSAMRFVCILKMALVEEYPLLEECEAILEISSQQDSESTDTNCLGIQNIHGESNDQVEKENNDGIVHKKLDEKIVKNSTNSKFELENESEDLLVKDDNGTSTIDGKNHCLIPPDVELFRHASGCDNSSNKVAKYSFLSDARKKKRFNSMGIEGSGRNTFSTDAESLSSDNLPAAKVCHDRDSNKLPEVVDSSSKPVERKAGKHKTKQTEDVEPAHSDYSADTDNFSSIKLSMALREGLSTSRTELEFFASKEKEITSRGHIPNGGACGESDNTPQKRKGKKRALKTYTVILRFPNAYSCSVWNIRKGTRSICIKYKPCFVDGVFNWMDRRITVALNHNELLLKLRCHPECFNSVAMELKWKARSFKRVRYYFNDPTLDDSDVASDPLLVQELQREDYDNKLFAKRKCKTKRQQLVPEKKPLYKCYNCHAESSNNVLDDAMRMKTDSPSKFLECHHHPGYLQRDKKWSCCGRDSCDIIDSDVRDQNDTNGCSWGEHIWRRYLPKNEKGLNHRDCQDLSRYYKKKLYYTG